MFDGFVFNGQSTKDFNMRVERYPDIGAPARKVSSVSVPGRNGDLHIAENAFSNYAMIYDVYFHAPVSSPQQAHAIKSWLLGSSGYCRLEDVYDPEHFRLATFQGPLDIANQLNKYGRCTIQFDCKPQSYLKSGERQIHLNAPGIIHNPCSFTSLPLIVVHGSGSGNLMIGSCTVEIKKISGDLTLDSEMQNAYSGNTNENSSIYAPEFPSLKPGDNTIQWSGGITGLEIIPRWWEL